MVKNNWYFPREGTLKQLPVKPAQTIGIGNAASPALSKTQQEQRDLLLSMPYLSSEGGVLKLINPASSSASAGSTAKPFSMPFVGSTKESKDAGSTFKAAADFATSPAAQAQSSDQSVKKLMNSPYLKVEGGVLKVVNPTTPLAPLLTKEAELSPYLSVFGSPTETQPITEKKKPEVFGFVDPGLLAAQKSQEMIKIAPYMQLNGLMDNFRLSKLPPTKEEFSTYLPVIGNPTETQKPIDWKARWDDLNRAIDYLSSVHEDANGKILNYGPVRQNLMNIRDQIRNSIKPLVDTDVEGYNSNWDPAFDPLVDSLVKESRQGEKVLNGLQFALDIAGLIPGAGEVADGLNALVSFFRGNYVDAGLSAAAMLPLAGWGATAGKYIKKAIKGVDAIAPVAKHADDFANVTEAFVKYTDEADELGESAFKQLEDDIEKDWHNPTEPDILGGGPKAVADGVGDGLSGPVEITPPSNATPEQIAQTKAYIDGSNQALQAGKLSPAGRVSTKGTLRDQASRSADRERSRAAAAGIPYEGQVGHVPDTTWMGTAEPFSWLDLDPSVNMSIGGQANRYPIGYKPTEFRFRDR